MPTFVDMFVVASGKGEAKVSRQKLVASKKKHDRFGARVGVPKAYSLSRYGSILLCCGCARENSLLPKVWQIREPRPKDVLEMHRIVTSVFDASHVRRRDGCANSYSQSRSAPYYVRATGQWK